MWAGTGGLCINLWRCDSGHLQPEDRSLAAVVSVALGDICSKEGSLQLLVLRITYLFMFIFEFFFLVLGIKPRVTYVVNEHFTT